jgi:hypothetical protein
MAFSLEGEMAGRGRPGGLPLIFRFFLSSDLLSAISFQPDFSTES